MQHAPAALSFTRVCFVTIHQGRGPAARPGGLQARLCHASLVPENSYIVYCLFMIALLNLQNRKLFRRPVT